MSEPEKPKTMGGTPVPIQDAPPPDANEVFGNPRNFPMLWKRTKLPNPVIKDPAPQFPTTPTIVKPK
jgi:hypothetical protein